MERRRNILVILIAFLCSSLCLSAIAAQAQTYADEMRTFLSQSGKIDFRKYQLLESPTARFGAGTMYPVESTKNDFDLLHEGIYGDTSSWWVTLSENDKLTALRAIVRPVEKRAIDLQGKHTRPLSLAAVFPQLAGKLRGKFDVDKIHVVINASGAYARAIDWLELDDAFYMEHLIKSSVVEHASKRDFVMTSGDLVLDGFEAHFTVSVGDAGTNAALTAALELFVQKSKSPFSLEREAGGYSLKSKQPIVAAVYLTLPPKIPWNEVGDRKLPPLTTPRLLSEISRAEQAGSVFMSE